MFPKVADTRHGVVPGARLLPYLLDMTDEDYNSLIRNPATGKPYPEGFMPELFDPTKGGGVAGRGVPGVVWRTLGVQFDQCVGNCEKASVGHSYVCTYWSPALPLFHCNCTCFTAVCECGEGLTGRDIPDLFYSVHFSCLQVCLFGNELGYICWSSRDSELRV